MRARPAMLTQNDPLTDALNRRTVAEIQRKVVKHGKRNAVTRIILSKSNKDRIAAWKQDLVRVLHVFNVCSIPSVVHSSTQPSPFRLSLYSTSTRWLRISIGTWDRRALPVNTTW